MNLGLPNSHSRNAAHTTVLLMTDDQGECREADEQVDEILKVRPLAKEEIHDIPVFAHPIAKCNKTPVEAADNHEDELYSM